MAVRNATHTYGSAAFTLGPGSVRGSTTSIEVVYYDLVGPDGQLAPFETFTLRRRRRDGNSANRGRTARSARLESWRRMAGKSMCRL
jgi:hypothetical protein